MTTAVDVLNQVLNASTLETAQAINTNHGEPLIFQCDESTASYDKYSLYFKDQSLTEQYGTSHLDICCECDAVVEDTFDGCEQCQF